MTSSTRLGGFKILKGLAHFSVVWPDQQKKHPADLYRAIAQKKINLPYCGYIHNEGFWCVDIIVDTADGLRVSLLFEEHFINVNHAPESAIISIFPHRKNPEIIGKLFEVFKQNRITQGALGNSPSAVSIIVREEELRKARDALFEPFSFSAYRTPEDWKLAQKGDEQLYKEVVATYQEQKPKVYGLEHYEGQQLLLAKATRPEIARIGGAFNYFAELGLHLTAAVLGPSWGDEGVVLAFCLPESLDFDYIEIIGRFTGHEADIHRISSVSVFSMNGPHFGDRYGIASELLTTFDLNGIDLLCLSCTIASITGVVPSIQIDSAIQAIQECFDVPAVIKK